MSNGPPKDHVEGEGGYDDEPAPRDSAFDAGEQSRASIDDHLTSRATWQRFVFMLVMALLFCLGTTAGCIVVLLQFFWVLFTGETKREFLMVGRQLAEYSREIVLYMTFVTNKHPFPFDRAWPSDEAA